MDKEMAAEVAIKARFHQGEEDSDGVPEVTDVADSTGAYRRRKTAEAIRPKEGMYQPIVSETSPEPNSRIHKYAKNVP